LRWRVKFVAAPRAHPCVRPRFGNARALTFVAVLTLVMSGRTLAQSCHLPISHPRTDLRSPVSDILPRQAGSRTSCPLRDGVAPPPLSFLHMAQGGVHHVLVGAEGGGRPAGVGPGTSPSVPKLTPILASLLSHRPTSPVFKVPVGGTLPTPEPTLVLLRFQATGSRLSISRQRTRRLRGRPLGVSSARCARLPSFLIISFKLADMSSSLKLYQRQKRSR
jgi:hypothetical protein